MEIEGIKIERYQNHARMYVENGIGDDKIFPIYKVLYKEFEEKCIDPVIVFYKCHRCDEWSSSAYPCYCQGYPTKAGSKFSCKP